MKDNEIIERIKVGDERSLDYLYQKYYSMMTRLVIRNSGTEDEAKDIYQDALVVFWLKVKNDQLVLTSKISTYIYSICQNLWRKELERKKRLSNETADGNTSMDFDKKERIEIVNKSVQAMGDTCRKVLSYYYFDNMSMSEIAEKLGFANADTAKTKKYKCKKELDKMIKSQYTAGDFMD